MSLTIIFDSAIIDCRLEDNEGPIIKSTIESLHIAFDDDDDEAVGSKTNRNVLAQ